MSEKGHSVIDADVRALKFSPEQIAERAGDVRLEIEYTVRNKDGSIAHQHTEEGDSFLSNFIKLLYCTMCLRANPSSGGSAITLTDTGGVARTGDVTYANLLSTYFMRCNNVANNADWGILVGTGSTAVTINDYALAAKVAQGTGAGQMEYGNHSIVSSTHDGSTYSYSGITRTVANNSGGAIVIAEVGLATSMYWDTATYRYFLLLREVLGSAVTVNTTQTLTATIRIKCYC